MRVFPIPREYVDHTIKPLIEGDYTWKGRPPTISTIMCSVPFCTFYERAAPGAIYHHATGSGIRFICDSSVAVRKACGGVC